MDLLEISQKRRMGREEAAKFLREVADSLARHNDLELMHGGMKVRVNVPDEVDVELEVEIESDESKIEIEISW